MAVRCKRVGRIGLLAFSFVRVLITVMDDRSGGDDAEGRASITHAQLRPSCALKLRTSLEAPGIQGRLLDSPAPRALINRNESRREKDSTFSFLLLRTYLF